MMNFLMVMLMMLRKSSRKPFSGWFGRAALPRPRMNANTSAVTTLMKAGIWTVKYGVTALEVSNPSNAPMLPPSRLGKVQRQVK